MQPTCTRTQRVAFSRALARRCARTQQNTFLSYPRACVACLSAHQHARFAHAIHVARRLQGGHLVKRLQKEGYWVRGVDIKRHEYFPSDPGDEFLLADMRDPTVN